MKAARQGVKRDGGRGTRGRRGARDLPHPGKVDPEQDKKNEFDAVFFVLVSPVVTKALIRFLDRPPYCAGHDDSVSGTGVVVMSMTARGQAPQQKAPFVIGPDGAPLTLADLPPKTTKRWVIRRKAEVVAAVRGGLLSLEAACERYTLTEEEYLSWEGAIDRHGLQGLRATKLQQYR